jgi:hypothetical protein
LRSPRRSYRSRHIGCPAGETMSWPLASRTSSSNGPTGQPMIGRTVSTHPVRRPGSGCPAVWCPARSVSGHPGSSSGSGDPAGCCPASSPLLSTRPVSSPLLSTPVGPVASVSCHLRGGVGTRSRRPGDRHHGNGSRSRWAAAPSGGWVDGPAGLDAGDAAEVARWSVGCRWRTGLGWGQAAAACARCAARQARPACGAACGWRLRRGQGSRLRRELAAPAGWLPSSGWVGDHGGWWSWRRPVGWPPDWGAGGDGVRPQRGPGWQRALPARRRQRCDLREWVVGLPGLEPGTSSLSEIDGEAPCYPASSQVVPIRRCDKDGVNRGPLLGRAERLLGNEDPHDEADHQAGAASRASTRTASDQGRVGVEVRAQAAAYALVARCRA